MKLTVEYLEQRYIIALEAAVSLAIPYTEGLAGVNCFFAPPVQYTPYKSGDFVGSVKAGAPVNFYDVRLNPHGNGTHTEGVGHISETWEKVIAHLKTVLCVAQLVSIFPQKMEDGDRVVTLEQLQAVCELPLPPALILRTYPNPIDKKTRHYGGTNPPYLAADAATWLAQNGVDHLLLDLPSVDREVDAGILAAHHAFWQFPEATRFEATITELIFVPDTTLDGLYLLNLQVSPLCMDAVPSNPIIFPLV